MRIAHSCLRSGVSVSLNIKNSLLLSKTGISVSLLLISLPAASKGVTLTLTGQVGISSSSISSFIVTLRRCPGTRGRLGSTKLLSSSNSSSFTSSDGRILILQLLRLSGWGGSHFHLTSIVLLGPQEAFR